MNGNNANLDAAHSRAPARTTASAPPFALSAIAGALLAMPLLAEADLGTARTRAPGQTAASTSTSALSADADAHRVMSVANGPTELEIIRDILYEIAGNTIPVAFDELTVPEEENEQVERMKVVYDFLADGPPVGSIAPSDPELRLNNADLWRFATTIRNRLLARCTFWESEMAPPVIPPTESSNGQRIEAMETGFELEGLPGARFPAPLSMLQARTDKLVAFRDGFFQIAPDRPWEPPEDYRVSVTTINASLNSFYFPVMALCEDL